MGDVLICYKSNLKNTFGTMIQVQEHDITSRRIRSGLFNCPSNSIKVKVTTLIARSRTAQPPRSHPQAIMGHHSQLTSDHIGKGLTFCRGAVSIFYNPSRQGIRDSFKQRCLQPKINFQCILYQIFFASIVSTSTGGDLIAQWVKSIYGM